MDAYMPRKQDRLNIRIDRRDKIDVKLAAEKETLGVATWVRQLIVKTARQRLGKV